MSEGGVAETEGSGRQEAGEFHQQGVKWLLRSFPESALLLGVGVLLLALGTTILFLDQGETGGSLAILLGGGSLIIAPLASRLEGSLRIGPVAMTLRQRVMKALSAATTETLEGILPLLVSDRVSVAPIVAPKRFQTRRLKDSELQFLRQKLNLIVIALKMPSAETWLAGGEVSEQAIEPGTVLLVAGPRESLDYFKAVVAADTEEMWRKVL